MKKKSILLKIFTVILVLAISLILFIWAFYGVYMNKPNPLYAHIHFLITMVILVLAGSLVASFLIRKILKPLSVLNEAVEKAAQGHLDHQISIKSNDELGSLAMAFNKMTKELKKMMVAREQLLSDVSHELRTPITRAWLALEMMQDSPEKESLSGDLKEMEELITGILESERLRNNTVIVNSEIISISALLNRLREGYRNSNRILIMPVSEEIKIRADESLLLTVLKNLVDNALKYSLEEDGPVEINVIQHENDVTISISDHGQGIPEEKLPFVFEPFFRVDQSRSRVTGGYGLGLHLCKRIMDLHKAELRLENNKGDKGLVALLIFSS
jgi:signal transduction histidine kinase